MTPSTTLGRARAGVVIAVLAAVLGVVLASFRVIADPTSATVGDSASPAGWKAVEYDGVRVDVPATWERVDTSDCEFRSERWARPDSAPCAFEDGLAFYGSATFDPAHGPGIRRTTEDGTSGWAGYTYAGSYAVYVFERERQLVRLVLASAREAE